MPRHAVNLWEFQEFVRIRSESGQCDQPSITMKFDFGKLWTVNFNIQTQSLNDFVILRPKIKFQKMLTKSPDFNRAQMSVHEHLIHLP